ncbi:hypothetical protein HDU98_002820 [Podochytrium sp. JEL0797]|nr:hypothetical protein HDU98_002820 [Podochytrium sp. JEL0797]
MEKEKRDALQQQQREKEKEMWREKKDLLKEKVTRHAQEKALQEAIQAQLLEESRHLQHLATEKLAKQEMERLKQRDADLMTQKKQREQTRQQASKDRELRLARIRASVVVRVSTDPSRVLSLTQGVANRNSTPREDAGKLAREKFSAVVLPRRSVPLWRAGL